MVDSFLGFLDSTYWAALGILILFIYLKIRMTGLLIAVAGYIVVFLSRVVNFDLNAIAETDIELANQLFEGANIAWYLGHLLVFVGFAVLYFQIGNKGRAT